MADPYASFSSIVEPPPVRPPPKDDPYASFSSPVQEGATTVDRAAAGAAGFNKGIGNLAGVPMSALVNLSNLASVGLGYLHSKITGQPAPDSIYGPVDPANVPLTSQWNVAHLGSAAQAPRPEDTASRYIGAAGEGATAAIAPGSAGARIPAAISGIVSAESQQAAGEAGLSPEAQMAAGFVGGIAPSAVRAGAAASTKQILRGGEQGRQQVAENIDTFKRAGTTPSVGQATEGRFARASESLLSKTPGGAGRMSAKGEAQAAEQGTNIENLAAKLAPKASGEQAGRAITHGISGEGGFVEKFKAKSGENYNELDKFVKPTDTFDVSNTRAALDKLTTPIKGAENTSGRLINTRIKAIKEALDADLAANNGVLPYKAVKELRTMIGDEMAGAPLGGDVPTAQWRKLYGGLSQDMQAAAAKSGPQAEAALNRANSYHAAGMKRMEVLGSVIDKAGGPEAVFRAATNGTKEGATTIRAVMQSLPDDARKTVSATVLRRMGRATAGKQDDLGEKFSTETFLTNWNTISPQAKAVLFDRYGPSFRADMDAVAKVASNLREGSKVFVNPSGTGQAVAQTSAGVGFITALATGHLAGAGAVAGTAGLANIGARAMTNPRVVNWLAKTARAPKSAVPALLTMAARSNDPDLQDLARALQGSNDSNNDSQSQSANSQ